MTFISKALTEWIVENGYLLFVTPSARWKPQLNPKKQNYRLMCINNQIIYLNMKDKSKGEKVFGCLTEYDYCLIARRIQCLHISE